MFLVSSSGLLKSWGLGGRFLVDVVGEDGGNRRSMGVAHDWMDVQAKTKKNKRDSVDLPDELTGRIMTRYVLLELDTQIVVEGQMKAWATV